MIFCVTAIHLCVASYAVLSISVSAVVMYTASSLIPKIVFPACVIKVASDEDGGGSAERLFRSVSIL